MASSLVLCRCEGSIVTEWKAACVMARAYVTHDSLGGPLWQTAEQTQAHGMITLVSAHFMKVIGAQCRASAPPEAPRR